MWKKQLLTYLASGAVGTAAHYGVFLCLVTLASVHPLWASVCGFVAGGVANYHLNYRVTFRSKLSHQVAGGRFFMVALSGLLLNTGIMGWGLEVLRLHFLSAQILATVLVFGWTFVVNKLWTFGALSA
ncbi:MAG: GtrA family protein [Candidatus Omnitrophica bacterium]|nr:GtrA family protein [Candidatus Omnitrophota bacterium]